MKIEYYLYGKWHPGDFEYARSGADRRKTNERRSADRRASSERRQRAPLS